MSAVAGALPRAWRRRAAAAVFVWWTVFGLVFSTGHHALMGIRGTPVSWWEALRYGYLDMYLWAAMCAAAFLLAWKLPLERRNPVGVVALHLASGAAIVSGRLLVEYGIARVTDWLPPVPLTVQFAAQAPSYSLFYFLLVAAGYAVAYFARYRQRELEAAQLETRITLAQLQALKVQIQPHFLFNTLNAIATLVREDPARAERMVEHLSEMLRTSLTHHQAQEVSVREELETLRPYLEIEKVRFGERLEVRLEVDPEVAGARLPHLLLQPLVENAIRHGISPRRRAGWVRVAVSGAGRRLRLRVEDNGRGMSGAVRPGAIGLENTRARLRQLYGEDHRFEIDSAPEEGTRIDIDIPLRPGAELAAPALAG